MGGMLLKRRQRIDVDRQDFEGRLETVSLKALKLPTSGEGDSLSTKELLALSSLEIAYQKTRNPTELKAYMAGNEKFLSTADWGERTKAVRQRDAIIDREAELLRMAGVGRGIVRREVEPSEVEFMIVTLRRMVPQLLAKQTDVNALLLEDEDLRQTVVAEALDFLKTPTVSTIPTEDSRTLAGRLPELGLALVEASNLRELREEMTVIEVEIADLDLRLADRGVSSLSPTERKQKTNRWSELQNRQSILQHQWTRTPPAEPELSGLLTAQDEVIRRSMFELGHRGALFAHRYDAQLQDTELDLQTPYSTWQLVEEQATLISDLEEARPDPGPLAGLPPRLDPRYLKAQKDLILAVKRSRPDLFRRLPPPSKPKNIKLVTPKASAIKAAAKQPRKKKSSGGRRRSSGGGRGRRR